MVGAGDAVVVVEVTLTSTCPGWAIGDDSGSPEASKPSATSVLTSRDGV